MCIVYLVCVFFSDDFFGMLGFFMSLQELKNEKLKVVLLLILTRDVTILVHSEVVNDGESDMDTLCPCCSPNTVFPRM